MADIQFKDALANITLAIEVLDKERLDILIEIGEKAITELCDSPAFSGLIAKAEEVAEKINKLRENEEELHREENERISRHTCYKCNLVNPDGAKFCEECGGKLGEPPREYCKSCKTMNLPTMKFCGECGTKLV